MERMRLRSGREVLLRPIRPQDEQSLRFAYERLSPRSKYHRFLAAKPHLSGSDARYLVQVDGSNHVALVALDAENPERMIGVTRFVRDPDEPHAAEMAVIVDDTVHREGLGRALLLRLLEEARAHGITRLRATMLTENRAAQALVRSLPAPISATRHRGPVEELELSLAGEELSLAGEELSLAG